MLLLYFTSPMVVRPIHYFMSVNVLVAAFYNKMSILSFPHLNESCDTTQSEEYAT